MARKLIIILISILVVSLLNHNLSDSVAHADSINIITDVPTLPQDFEGTASTLIVKENHTAFQVGERFRLVLPSGLKWNYSSNGNFKGTVSGEVYEEAASYIRLDDHNLEVTIGNIGNSDVQSPDQIEIPINVSFNNVEGELKLQVDAIDSVLTSGQYTFAKVAKNTPPPNEENRLPIPRDYSETNWGLYLGVNPALFYHGSNLAVDPDGDPLTIIDAKSDKQGVVDIDISDGSLKIIPVSVGEVILTATVSDGRGGEVTVTPLMVTVKEPYLLSLTISSEKGVLAYNNFPIAHETSAIVTNEVDSVTITAIARDHKFKITLNQESLINGQPSNPIKLTEGDNQILISVKDNYGNSRIFPITINRSDDSSDYEPSIIVTKIPILKDDFDGEASILILKPNDIPQDGDFFILRLSEGAKWNTYFEQEGSIDNAVYERLSDTELKFTITGSPENVTIPLNISVIREFEGRLRVHIISPSFNFPNGESTYAYVAKYTDEITPPGDNSNPTPDPGDEQPPIDECFIATAAYGSKFTPAVTLLREFRDQYLMTNSVGLSFVQLYYHYSPPIANFIASSEVLKVLVRVFLTPIVIFVYVVMRPILLTFLASTLAAMYLRKKGFGNIFKAHF